MAAAARRVSAITSRRLLQPQATTARYASTKPTTSTRIQGDSVGEDVGDVDINIMESGNLSQGTLKSQPGYTTKKAALEKLGPEEVEEADNEAVEGKDKNDPPNVEEICDRVLKDDIPVGI